MKGIQCAFTGKLGQDPELKTSKAGNPWVSFSVAIDEVSEETTTWVRVAVFGELATRLHPELKSKRPDPRPLPPPLRFTSLSRYPPLARTRARRQNAQKFGASGR
jgi:hypothetical protein